MRPALYRTLIFRGKWHSRYDLPSPFGIDAEGKLMYSLAKL